MIGRHVLMVKSLSRVLALALCASSPLHAQMLPSDPIAFADGRVTLGGDVSWSIAPEDTGFFNYTDYDHSSLRMVRLSLAAALQAGKHLALLAEVRSENGGAPAPYGFYLRIRPWTSRNLDIQVGRVPPTFGAFSRRTYPEDNPLISYPLAYQYLTAIRADALPGSVDELLRMRGRGWLTNYSVGNLDAEHGLPLVSAFRWDTGVQLHAENDLVDGTMSVTSGTLSNPGFHDDNGGPQVAGRLALHPTAGLVVGASGARGAFVTRTAVHDVLPGAAPSDFTQTAWGADVEYSRGYYLVRAETVVSRWTLPLLQSSRTELPLTAAAVSLEGRYKIRPGLYVAARLDHLGFSEIADGATRQTWDAPVTRWDVGGGYSLQRNLLLKLDFQHNIRDGGRVTEQSLGSAQLVFWF
jgi:hypothetical protein